MNGPTVQPLLGGETPQALGGDYLRWFDTMNEVPSIRCLIDPDVGPSEVARCFEGIPKSRLEGEWQQALMQPWLRTHDPDRVFQVVKGVDKQHYLVVRLGGQVMAIKLRHVIGYGIIIGGGAVVTTFGVLVFAAKSKRGKKLLKAWGLG